MSSGTDQIARLLALTPYLQRHPGVSLEKAAADFGITERQLCKDLSVAFMVGLPGQMPDDLIEVDMDLVHDKGVIFLTNAEFLARPLRFTPDEVLALIVGLRAARDIAGPDAAAAIESALAKLENAAGESAEAAARVDVRLRSADDAVREGIADAIARGVALDLAYDSAKRGETTRRRVEPHSVTTRDGFAYLEAWSEGVDGAAPGWRMFRLDRIVELTPTSVPAADHGEPPARDGGWLDHAEHVRTVSLDVAPEAAWIAEYHPVDEVEELPDGGRRVRLRIADPGFLSQLLLRLGGAVRAIDPPEAGESARSAATDSLAQYAALFGEESA